MEAYAETCCDTVTAFGWATGQVIAVLVPERSPRDSFLGGVVP